MGYKKFSVEIEKNGAGFGVSKKFPNDECQCLHYRLKHGQIVRLCYENRESNNKMWRGYKTGAITG